MKLKKCFKKTGLAAGQMGHDPKGPAAYLYSQEKNFFFLFK